MGQYLSWLTLNEACYKWHFYNWFAHHHLDEKSGRLYHIPIISHLLIVSKTESELDISETPKTHLKLVEVVQIYLISLSVDQKPQRLAKSKLELQKALRWVVIHLQEGWNKFGSLCFIILDISTLTYFYHDLDKSKSSQTFLKRGFALKENIL